MENTDLRFTGTPPHIEMVIKNPELSDWHCELFGTGTYMTLNPVKGKEPNRFWMLMQYLCFGNKWRRKEIEKELKSEMRLL